MHVLATVNVYLGPHHVVITGKQAEKTFTEPYATSWGAYLACVVQYV